MQWSKLNINDRWAKFVWELCFCNQNIFEIILYLFKFVIKHQQMSIWLFKLKIIWIMWMIFDINLSFINLSLIDFCNRMMKNLYNLTYLRLTKIRSKTFIFVIKKVLTLIWKMNTNDVKFNWRSFSKFIIDLKSLTKIKMFIFAKIVWMTKFLNFLTLTCSNLFFYFWLKLSSEIKRFSSHCRLKKQN